MPQRSRRERVEARAEAPRRSGGVAGAWKKTPAGSGEVGAAGFKDFKALRSFRVLGFRAKVSWRFAGQGFIS